MWGVRGKHLSTGLSSKPVLLKRNEDDVSKQEDLTLLVEKYTGRVFIVKIIYVIVGGRPLQSITGVFFLPHFNYILFLAISSGRFHLSLYAYKFSN